jgi:plasmid stabilization system protein ParE
MNRTVVFLPAAREDIARTFDWYETRRPGLGFRFLVALEDLVSRITRHPEGYAHVVDDFRRGLVKRFPYSLFYELIDDRVMIYGVFHHADDPDKWRQRLAQPRD